MTKLEAISAANTFRRDADELLQRMKDHKKELCSPIRPVRSKPTIEELEVILAKQGQGTVSINPDGSISGGENWGDDTAESIAQHTLSIRDLESAIMRQGMALKYIGNPDPYPESRNPDSPVVAPAPDHLIRPAVGWRASLE